MLWVITLVVVGMLIAILVNQKRKLARVPVAVENGRAKTEWHYLLFVMGMLIVLLALYSLISDYNNSPVSYRVRCMSNIKQCQLGNLIYAEEHDDHLPQAVVWMDQARPYLKSEKLFKCAELEHLNEKGYGYAMNVQESGSSVSHHPNPKTTPVVFDSILLEWNACSGFYGFPNRRNRKPNVVYLDGHVARISLETVERSKHD